MQYAYEAIDAYGKREQGRAEAETPEEVYQALKMRGLLATKIEPARFKAEKRMGAKDLAVFFRQFAALTQTGDIMLNEALRILADQVPTRFQDKLRAAATAVDQGETLPQALRKAGFVPPLAMAFLEVSESTGKRPEVLSRLAEHYTREASYISKIKRALTYPAATLGLALILSYAMLTLVVPTMVGVLKDLNVAIPLPTRILIFISELAKNPVSLTLILGGGALAIYAWRQSLNNPAQQERLDRFMLRVPILGPTLRRTLLARIARTVSMVYSSGLPLQQGLRMAAEVAGNWVYKKALSDIRSLVENQGSTLHGAMTLHPEEFPRLYISLVKIGETTSDLGEMLNHVASMYEEEVEATMDNLQALIEPLLLVFVGVVVGGMLLAVMLPYFSLAQGLGGQ